MAQAIKIAVIESERGWGSKIDDYMVCLDVDDAKAFAQEFNSYNISETTPDWYMVVESEPTVIELNDKQYEALLHYKRIWLSGLKNIK